MFNVNYNVPASVYSGGNVSFDSSPYVRYALQTAAQNKAKDEAFLRSFQDMAAGVTPAGVAANDINSLMQKKQEWIDSVMKNRDNYENPENDNGKAYGEAMAKYNQILTHAQTSRDKVKQLAAAGSVFKDPNKRTLLTDQALLDYHNGSLPVDDPSYQEFDPSSLDYNAKPLGINDINGFGRDMKALVAPSLKNHIPDEANIITDSKSHTKTIPWEVKLTDKDYQNIQARASSLYSVNPSWKSFFDNEMNNMGDYNNMNDIYKQHFGKDSNIQDGKDMAVAFGLSSINDELHGKDIKSYTPDTYYAHRDYAVAHPLVNGLVDDGFGDVKNQIQTIQQQTGQPTMIPLAAVNRSDVRDAMVSSIERASKKKIDAKNISLVLGNDGTIRAVPTKGGDVLDVFNPQDINSAIKLNSSANQKQQIIQSGNPNVPKSATYKAANGKNYSHGDLLKMGYTEEQIQQAIKLGNLR